MAQSFWIPTLYSRTLGQKKGRYFEPVYMHICLQEHSVGVHYQFAATTSHRLGAGNRPSALLNDSRENRSSTCLCLMGLMTG